MGESLGAGTENNVLSRAERKIVPALQQGLDSFEGVRRQCWAISGQTWQTSSHLFILLSFVCCRTRYVIKSCVLDDQPYPSV